MPGTAPSADARLRALYIVSAYPRWPGDVITPWLVETVRRLRSRGVDVEVLAPAYRGGAGGEVDGVRVHRFRYAPRPLETLTHDQTAPDRIRERPASLALVPGYVASAAIAASRLARSGRFDLLHAFWPLPHGLVGLVAKRASGTPLVSTFFGVELTWMERQLPFLAPVLRRIVRGSDAVTAISTYTAGRLEAAAPGTRSSVIPFGIAVEKPTESPPPPFLDPGQCEVLFVGRLVERKGVHVLLEALHRLGSTGVRARIVGDGPERAALEIRARELGVLDRTRFHGFVPPEELLARLASCDVFVLPAVVDRKGDTEGLGVVLLEAMAHSRPVVASRAGGIVDIVRSGHNGELVPPGDAGALAEAIARLADDPDAARRMGARGAEDVRRRFSWDSILDRLDALYRSALGGEAPR